MEKSATSRQVVPNAYSPGVIMGRSRSTVEPPTLRPDGMRHWMIHFTLVGRGRVNRGESQFECGPGAITLFPPGVVHDYAPARKDGYWEHLWVYFQPRPQWYPYLEWPDCGDGVRSFSPQSESVKRRIGAALNASYRQLRSADRIRSELAANYLEQSLLWCMSELGKTNATAFLDPRIAQIVDYIQRRYAAPLRLSQLATRANLSSTRFSHLFAECMGMPLSTYVTQVRLERARELLTGSMRSVSEVSFACGFSDSLYFSKTFRKAFGLSPTKYRRGIQEGRR